jgi:glycosyltransferase involved in cell wall biosynthesis
MGQSWIFRPRPILSASVGASAAVAPRPAPAARLVQAGFWPEGLLRTARALARETLPSPVLDLVHQVRRRRALPSARPVPRPAFESHVTVLGFLSAPTGLGEGARSCAGALADLGHVVGLIDATPWLGVAGGVQMPRRPSGLIIGDAGGPLICHLNPIELQAALMLARLSGRERRVIGYWAWELPEVPPGWRAAFRLVHEIWVPSRFVAAALLRSGCAVPIRVVPHPLAAELASPPVPDRVPGVLTVLTMFAHESGFDRKNPLGAIDAFRAAFRGRSDTRLIVKTRGKSLSGAPERRLAARVASARDIEVIDGEFSAADMQRLLAGADILLSMHRAEGFGIPMARAMLLGKPVVATRWSGNLDFMNDATACLVPAALIPVADESPAYRGMNSCWAEPSVTAAADWLRRLEDADLRRRIGAAGRARATTILSLGAFADAVAPSLGRHDVNFMFRARSGVVAGP